MEAAVNSIVEALLHLKEPKEKNVDTCLKHAGGRRRTLLCSGGDFAFALFLKAIGKTMFRHADSGIPLSFFGAVVGDGSYVSSFEKKVSNAASYVVKLCLEELKSDEGDIFRRISPLLMLRRTPSAFFRIWYLRGSCDPEVLSMLQYLSHELAIRLDIMTPDDDSYRQFTAEERRLAAELSGRCLPFSLPDENAARDCTTFARICFPAFQRTIDAFDNKISNEDVFRRARAALYAACHHIPLAHDEDDGSGVMATFDFIVRVLMHESSEEQGLIQLQTGGIDFLAICLESWSTRQKQNNRHYPLIEEIPPSQDATPREEFKSHVCVLSEIHHFLVQCITHKKTLVSKSPTFLEPKPPTTSHRTCLLNAIISVAQRCPVEGSQYDILSNGIVPELIHWATGGTVDNDLRHPLCIAGALQTTFIFITRSKSLRCLIKGNSGDVVSKTFQWALDIFRKGKRGSYAESTLRIASLKLMLAVVTIDQYNSSRPEEGYPMLSPREVREAFAVISGAVNADADPEVRKLAASTLVAMR